MSGTISTSLGYLVLGLGLVSWRKKVVIFTYSYQAQLEICSLASRTNELYWNSGEVWTKVSQSIATCQGDPSLSPAPVEGDPGFIWFQLVVILWILLTPAQLVLWRCCRVRGWKDQLIGRLLGSTGYTLGGEGCTDQRLQVLVKTGMYGQSIWSNLGDHFWFKVFQKGEVGNTILNT